MNKLVIDTNIIVAKVDDKDVHHKKALSLVLDIEEKNLPVVLMENKKRFIFLHSG